MNRVILISFAFLLFFSSCHQSNRVKVGLLLHDVEGRWISELEYLKRVANEEGVELIVKSAGNNQQVQIEQVNELIDEGVGSILVVAVDQIASGDIVRRAHKSNVPIIAYDRIIRYIDLDYLITYDYAKVGALMVDYAVKRVPKGNYVIFWGDASDANAQAIRVKQTEMLKPYIDRGDIHMIYRTHVDGWSDVYAKNQMENILNFSSAPVDVILASNDVIANAVLDVAYKHNSSAKILVTGQDATLEGCRSVVQGRQTMTIYKSTIKMAQEGILLAKKLAMDKPVEKPLSSTFNGRFQVPTFFLQPTVADQSNMQAIIVADGVFTKEELYN